MFAGQSLAQLRPTLAHLMVQPGADPAMLMLPQCRAQLVAASTLLGPHPPPPRVSSAWARGCISRLSGASRWGLDLTVCKQNSLGKTGMHMLCTSGLHHRGNVGLGQLQWGNTSGMDTYSSATNSQSQIILESSTLTRMKL